MEVKQILFNYLSQHSNFTDPHIEMIGGFFQPLYLEKEETLFKKGSRFRKIVFVAEGVLRSFILDINGEEITKTFITPNEFFTEIDSFEKDEPCAFNVSAVTECKLLTLSKDDAEILKEHIPGWEISMKEEAVKAMNSMFRRQEFLNIGEAADKYRHFVDHFPDLAQILPLKYIASYLQITQSSLSRIRRQSW
jgi:CRP-like cAMP-binding protein